MKLFNIKKSMLENFEKSNLSNHEQEHKWHEVPLSIINEMEKDNLVHQQLEADADVWERYTVKEHTLMVMTQFEKYFSKERLPLDFKTNSFRKILAIHDIGKPKALAEKDKEKQHEYTKIYAPEILAKQGLTDEEIKIAQALFTGDPIGDYIIKSENLSTSAKEIAEMAKSAGVETSDFFELLTIFYQVDASAYTEDASIKGIVQGEKSLDYLFDFNHQKHRLDFSPDIGARVKALREFLLKNRTEDEPNMETIKTVILFGNKEYPMNIEFRRKVFEYPSDIQKETEFVGYERKTVDWDNIITTYKEILKDQKVSVETIELEELLSLKEFEHRKEPYGIFEIKRAVQAKLFSVLWHVLGDESFPNLTFNHSVGGYQEVVEGYQKQLIHDKVLLQKIYHPSVWAQMARRGIYIGRGQNTAKFALKDEKNNQVKELHLDIGGEVLSLTRNLNNIVFDKQFLENFGQSKRLDEFRKIYPSGAVDIYGKTIPHPQIDNSMYADYVEEIYKHIVDNNQYLITSASEGVHNGLSVSIGMDENWIPRRGMFLDPVFGFDIKSKPFGDYLVKIFRLEGKLRNDIGTPFSEYSETRKLVALKNVHDEINEKSITEWRKQHYHFIDSGNHPFIPIVINHKDIPELRWGHAQYASMPTKKGLNVITMRYNG